MVGHRGSPIVSGGEGLGTGSREVGGQHREFKWTGQKEEAALLVAEDRLRHRDIAARLGVTSDRLSRWKMHPDFRARVDSHVEAMREAIMQYGIASRTHRIMALHDRWCRMIRLIEARAQEMADVPGGDTGLLAREVKRVKVRV